MQAITLQSLGEVVPVQPVEMLEFHRLGMGWYEYEKLRATNTHEDALAAFKAEWTALGYGYRFTR